MFTRTGLPGERQVYRTSGSLVAWWAWVTFAVVLLIVLALNLVVDVFGRRSKELRWS